MLDTVTHETFESLIGQKFTLFTPDQAQHQFELTDVEQLPIPRRRSRAAADSRRAPFSIFFIGEPLLPQAIYPIRHDALSSEPLNIFIVPLGKAEGGYEYEAVFT
jgi:hypothetical protein